jgi:hypothetical protein
VRSGQQAGVTRIGVKQQRLDGWHSGVAEPPDGNSVQHRYLCNAAVRDAHSPASHSAIRAFGPTPGRLLARPDAPPTGRLIRDAGHHQGRHRCARAIAHKQARTGGSAARRSSIEAAAAPARPLQALTRQHRILFDARLAGARPPALRTVGCLLTQIRASALRHPRCAFGDHQAALLAVADRPEEQCHQLPERSDSRERRSRCECAHDWRSWQHEPARAT